MEGGGNEEMEGRREGRRERMRWTPWREGGRAREKEEIGRDGVGIEGGRRGGGKEKGPGIEWNRARAGELES